ncbi:MAG: AmmeMemoRadiSam system protein B [Candidatus Altiarchaeales archaeon]|nr:AmmeMemoRadiSam system protein B [Candidatus Altiarchaeales archaeon]MBD3416058.1 AmmeMemoRadiSam system protein B [Candidatus Altiarchaeales archaeon]
MIRRPAVAGQFYSGSVSGLKEQVESCLDLNAERFDALGVVSPHAGLMYSGPVAGAVYSRINMPDTFVILGPNHHGLGADFGIMTEGIWNMPFGDVRVDSMLAREIFKNCGSLEEDPFGQEREHSLEVQVPFMQYFSDSFQIVPIALRHYSPDEGFLGVCEDIGNAIASVVSKVDSRVVIVASTDFTHYQPQEVAEENDHAALDAILSLDAGALFKEVSSRGISMCGYAPVAVMLTACKGLGASRAELVKYLTSGDTTGDYSAVVGYGGVVVR